MNRWSRWLLTGVALVLAVTSCAAPASVPTTVAERPTLTLGALAVVEHLANKGNFNWQDGTFNYPPLMERLKAKQASYKTLASSVGAATVSSLGTATTNVPCFAKEHVDYDDPTPAPNDRLYVLTDAGDVKVYNPSSVASGAIATKTLTPAGANTYGGTALMLSGDNNRLYALSKTGYLVVMSTKAPYAVLYSQKISSVGFNGMSGFLDYSADLGGGGQFGNNERMYAVSTDGSIYRLDFSGNAASCAVAVKAFTASNGTDKNTALPAWNGGSASIPYGVAITASNYPIAWRSKVIFGTTTGQLYSIDLTGAPAVTKYNLAAKTSGGGSFVSIAGPAAADFDDDFNISAIFAACGDRLNWIDIASGKVVSSPSLTLDHLYSTGNNYPVAGRLGGTAPAYVPANTGKKSYTISDWISIQSASTGSLTRWSGPPLPAVSSTGVVAVSVRIAPNGEIWCTDQSTSKVYRYDQYGTALPTSAVAPVNPITLPNGTNKGPIKLEFDSTGACWVVSGQIPAGGYLTKLNPDGTKAFATLTAASYLYLAVDKFNNCWTVDFNNQRLYKYNASGALQAGFPVNLSGATTVYCDPYKGDAWVTTFGAGGNKVYKVAQNGTYSTITVGTQPIYVDFDPVAPNNAWVTNNGSNSISVVNTTTNAVTSTIATAAKPWAVRFDAGGTPWISHMDYFGANPKSVSRLNRAGAVQASYAMGGRPFELSIDSSGTVWVATDAGLYRITDLGNISDLFASADRLAAGDGNDSLAFTRFQIPSGNNFGTQVALKATLDLVCAATSTDTIQLYEASPDRTATAPWVGYAGTPTVNWNNRPALLTGAPFFTGTSTTYTKDAAAYSFDVPTPGDQVNSSYTGGQAVAYGIRSANELLSNAVHFYSPHSSSAGGSSSKYPVLTVTLDTAGVVDTSKPGLVSQPVIDALTKTVYVSGCNAMFQLSYANFIAWQSPSSVYYNLTQAGRTLGPVNASKQYMFAEGNVLLTPNRRVVTADVNTNGQLYLNDFNVNNAPTTDRLGYFCNVAPGKGAIADQMLFDYTSGSAYAVTKDAGSGSYYVIKAPILQ